MAKCHFCKGSQRIWWKGVIFKILWMLYPEVIFHLSFDFKINFTKADNAVTICEKWQPQTLLELLLWLGGLGDRAGVLTHFPCSWQAMACGPWLQTGVNQHLAILGEQRPLADLEAQGFPAVCSQIILKATAKDCPPPPVCILHQSHFSHILFFTYLFDLLYLWF